VALVIESSREYGRGLLLGIARYAREHGQWSMFFRPRALDQAAPAWLRRWRGDGILARIENRRMARLILAAGRPTIDLRRLLPELGLPHVGADHRAAVTLAVDHLRDRGFRHFGFCACPWDRLLEMRSAYFAQRLDPALHTWSVLRVMPRRGRAATWEQQQRQIAGWIKRLPRPVGILAGNDDCGLQVLDACHRAGRKVPEDVAVVGIDNDEYVCRVANPPLSSVDLNLAEIGYRAAELLERMMSGQRAPAEPVVIAPRGVVTRQSTDILAIEDRLVAEAVQIIRRRACDGLLVETVARQLAVSRSSLERRFEAVLKRSPKAEMLRVQLDRATELLAWTELSIATIAERSGFASAKYFSETFHRRSGMTAQEYRRRYRTAN
jgi:LacI family transcriptional regulator